MPSKSDVFTVNLRMGPDEPDDPAADLILLAVGRAIAAWTIVEYELSAVYLEAAHPGAPSASGLAAFGAIKNFKERLEITSVALKTSLDASDPTHFSVLSEWGALYFALDKLAERRNKIAHGAVVRGRFGKPSLTPYWVPYLTMATLVRRPTS